MSPDNNCVHVDRNGISKLVATGTISWSNLFCLAPIIWPTLVALENIDGASLCAVGVSIGCAHDDGVTADSHTKPKLVGAAGVAARYLFQLVPGIGATQVSRIQISRPGFH